VLEPITEHRLEHGVLRHLWVIDDDLGKRARANRERTIERVLGTFRGSGIAAGNSPGTKWTAFSAIAEHLDTVGATRRGLTRCSGPLRTLLPSSAHSIS
jgi:hypothetical protein